MFSFIRDQFDSECIIKSIPIEVRRHKPSPDLGDSLGQSWTYQSLMARQDEISTRVRQGQRGCLLVSEVSPVITLGKRASEEKDLLLSIESLQKLKIEVLKTRRGGLATYHGPGQWVLFPVDRLDRLCGDSRGVRKVVESLLEVALQVGLNYDSTAEIRTGAETGVWTSKGKFASVGVQIENGVLLHGLAVNGYSTLSSFQGVRPCGLSCGVDYLLRKSDLSAEKLELEFQNLGEQLVDGILTRLW